jgi:tetratricopeptide (TPR) repeat protein
MPQIFERKRHHKRVIVAAVGSVVLVVAVFGVVTFLKYQAAQADNRSFDSATQLAKLDNSRNDFSTAATVWISYGDSTSNKAHKTTAYNNAAGQYVAGGQYAKAIVMCKRSEAVSGVTFGEAEVAATAYQAMGDTQNAIKYYNYAIKLIPTRLVDHAGTQAAFQHAIQELQASP